jgi:predicted GH43/DUF377 family glycosyl hydrolase
MGFLGLFRDTDMQNSQMPKIDYSKGPVLEIQPDVPWADTLVFNPAIVKEPGSADLHMLFRGIGPWPQARTNNGGDPYPCFLGYAVSKDNGVTWQADWSRPALSPAMNYKADEIRVKNDKGEMVVDYSNGCIEDPRLIWLDGELLLTVACRMFPPGAYWIVDDPMQCAPDWARAGQGGLGKAASENRTVTVLYKVDLAALKARKYDAAFQYITHLTDPDRSDNRDAFLFPERMMIDGRMQYVLIHRPKDPYAFPLGSNPGTLNIYVTAADSFRGFLSPSLKHEILAEPREKWEANRIGASFPPIRISDSEWLLPTHGKQDDIVGYTQTFMILKDRPNQLPVVTHRCTERLMYAKQKWELEGRFTIPCMFPCGAVVIDGELIIGYGAADERIGIARVNFDELVSYIRRFPVK